MDNRNTISINEASDLNFNSQSLNLNKHNNTISIELKDDDKSKLSDLGKGIISSNEEKTVSGKTVYDYVNPLKNDIENIKRNKGVGIDKKYVDDKFEESKEIASGIANAIAISSLPVNFKDGRHSHTFASSYGNYGNNHAFAIGISGQGLGIIYKAAASINTKAKFSVGAGIGYTFYDEKINENNSYSELKKENEELKNKLNEVEKKLEKLLEKVK